MTHTEWRLLFVLRDLDDASAMAAFVALHVPLLFLILWLSHHSSERLRRRAQLVISGFLPVHAVLHYSLSGQPNYTFEGLLSNSLIFGAGLFGGAHLIQLLRRSADPNPA